VDAPATLDRVGLTLPTFQPSFTLRRDLHMAGNGRHLLTLKALGQARQCVPDYNASMPIRTFPDAASRLAPTSDFLGNRLPDREARVEGILSAARPLVATKDVSGRGSG